MSAEHAGADPRASRRDPRDRGPDRSPAENTAENTAGRVLVVVPTYNEAASLPAILDRLRAAVSAADVLVVDDDSPDGTGALADERSAVDPRVHVLHRPSKEGLGVAYRAGFGWGFDRGYDVLVEMDADGSHQPEELPRLLARLRDADLVIGSRWVRGGRVLHWPAHRMLLSRGANLYARLALGIPVRDATAGFRAFRRRTLEGIDLDDVSSQGYCFQIDLAWRAVVAGFRVAEVPITFVERERGASKMSRQVVGESLWRVATWAARHRARQLSGLADRIVRRPTARRR